VQQARLGALANPGRRELAFHASVAMISAHKWQHLGHVLNSPLQVFANREGVAWACRNMDFESVIQKIVLNYAHVWPRLLPHSMQLPETKPVSFKLKSSKFRTILECHVLALKTDEHRTIKDCG
jgi:hypothetical protein